MPSTRTSSSPGSSHAREPRGKLQDRGSSLPEAPQAPRRRRHIRHRAFLRRDGQLHAPPRGGDPLQPPGLARRGQPHPKGIDRLRGAAGSHMRDQVHAASNESGAILVRGAHHAALRVRVVVLDAHIKKSITVFFFRAATDVKAGDRGWTCLFSPWPHKKASTTRALSGLVSYSHRNACGSAGKIQALLNLREFWCYGLQKYHNL